MRETKFKKTDIGLIPEDWEIMSISKLFDLGNGYTPSKAVSVFWNNGNIPWFRIEDIRNNGNVLNDSILHITQLAVKGKLFPANSFIISTSATVGEYAYVTVPYIANQRFVCLIKKTDSKTLLDDNYFLCLCESLGQWCRDNCDQGSSFVSVNMPSFKNHMISLPPLEEQRKIAKALSDIDGLIQSLTKLIEKKKNIKTATMQQLLTGKKRLEGFTEPWVETEIGDIIKIYKGQSLQSKNFINGNVPVVAGGQTYAGFHNLANHKKTSVTISASGAYAGYVWLHEYPIFASDCSVIEGNDNVDIHFLYNVLKLKQNEIYKSQTGGAQPHIHPKDIEPIKIVIPFKNGKPFIEEQSAIATILSDMDAEILALEKKKAKYEFIKNGMMQELLTGKIRLI